MQDERSPQPPRYLTRSSSSQGDRQSPPNRLDNRSSPLQRTDEPTPCVRADDTWMYRMHADVVVKDTVCGRDLNGRRLDSQTFQGQSWDDVKVKIFNYILPHVKAKATYTGDPRVWTVAPGPITIDDFDAIVSMKMGRNFFRPTNSEHANRYLSDHRHSTFSILVFKYGNRVCTSSDIQEFNQQCVLPQIQDRAGAAAEVTNQAMVHTLKQKWSEHFQANEATWRMWAAMVLRKPVHEQPALIAAHPPSQMIHLFDSIPNGAQGRNANFQRSLVLARDVVQAAHEDLARICIDAESVVVRVKAALAALEVQRRTIESSLEDVTPSSNSQETMHLLQDIPNIQDLDHME